MDIFPAICRKGIQKITMLPDGDFGELWESIYVEEGVKDRLLSHAVLNFTVRPKVKRSFCRFTALFCSSDCLGPAKHHSPRVWRTGPAKRSRA